MLDREGFQLCQKEDTYWNRTVKEESKVFLLSYRFEYEGRGLGCPELPLRSKPSSQEGFQPPPPCHQQYLQPSLFFQHLLWGKGS